MSAKEKLEISSDEHQRHDKDTGSSEVQIVNLTQRINHLVDHLKSHKKDHHSRRGLLLLVGRRRRLMRYLSRKDRPRLEQVAKKLKLKINV